MQNSHRFFENRDCKYFPCHTGLEAFNCLFCYCPLYGLKDCPGRPRYKDNDGKKVKICTDCDFPHRPENYEAVVGMLKNMKTS